MLFVRGSATFDPFATVRALSEGLTTADAWKAECHALGIAGQPLGHAAAIHAVVSMAATTVTKPLTAPRRPTPIDQINCYRCKHPLPVSAESRGKTVKGPQYGTEQQLPL